MSGSHDQTQLRAQGPELEHRELLEAPLSEFFQLAAERWPERSFLSSRVRDESYDFGSFERQARSLAAALRRAGVETQTRVLLWSDNRPAWCLAYAAVLYAGGVVVPLDASVPVAGAESVLRQSGARLAICDHERAQRLAGRDVTTLELDQLAGLAAADRSPPPAPAGLRGGDTLAAILYTSGTTASPKGVMLTHRNLAAELLAIGRALEFRPDDSLLMFLPLHHVLAQIASFLAPIAFGLRVVHVAPGGAQELLSALREERITILMAVPQLYHLIHERVQQRLTGRGLLTRSLATRLLRLCGTLRGALGLELGRLLFRSLHRNLGPGLRLMVSGGSALNPRAQRDFLALGFTLAQAYGLTETSGGATFTPPRRVLAGSVGQPLAGFEVQIHEPDGHGVGEVWLRGPAVTPGYHERPEASAEVLVDGWLRTGDLGRLDRDGNLFLTGRSKEIIVLEGGKNVVPEELETHYAQAPSVRELCVLGRHREGSGSHGEHLHAVVVPDWERLEAEGVSSVRDRVVFELESLSLELPRWQHLTSFELRHEPLPRTATRKLQRFLVQQQLQQEAGAAEPEPDPPELAGKLDTPVGRKVLEVLAQQLPDQPIRARSHLELDLGLDSLNRMELLLKLEAVLGVSISDEDAARPRNVAQLVELCQSLSPAEHGAGGPDDAWQRLVDAADPAELAPQIRGQRSALSWLALRSTLALGRLLARLLFRLRVEGAELLPRSGPALICPNHVSFLDGFLVACALPWEVARRSFVLGEFMYVGEGLSGRLARFFAVVPTDPNLALRRSMELGAAGLKGGRILLVFPEGTRSATGRLQPLKQGAPLLSSELEAPITPCVISGAYEAWPRSRRWPRPGRIGIRFGAPIDPGPLTRTASSPSEGHAAVSLALRRALVELGAPEP